jgi:hypothetical protein
MAINTGTLVSAAIRPNDSLDPIASAFASEIKGGLHTVQNITNRNAIIFERREWGMMCYVINDNKTYQLEYNLQDTNIMNNNNWTEFSGSGGSGGGEWIDSVLSVLYNQPVSPINGARYLVGRGALDLTPITGIVWSSYQSGQVTEWNSTLSVWQVTTPTDGMSVRVDNDDNSIYRYEGNFPSGNWAKEQLGQVRNLSATAPNGISYSATTQPPISGYIQDMIFLTQFSDQNITSTASININGLGEVLIKKPSQSGPISLIPSDIVPNVVYSLSYDGTYFQLNKPFRTDDVNFNVKYYIEPTDYIVVPQYYQYWVYSDLEIAGNLINYGQVIIANGSMILSGGTFSNYGQLTFVSFAGMTTSYNNSDTIQFTQSNTIFGLSVSAEIIDGSLTASKLNTDDNGGATAGYILSVDSDGYFQWVENISEVDASNGLSIATASGDVILGGTLLQNTEIDADGNDFTISNANNILLQSDNSTIASTNIDILSGDFTLSFDTATIVDISGASQGLVYAADYSSGFIDESLVTKRYVDNSISNIDVILLSSSDKNYVMTYDTNGDNQFTGLTISQTPVSGSYVAVFINGQEFQVGVTNNNAPCYFSDDGGLTAKINIVAGDGLYWNGNIAGTDLYIGWRISLFYLT